MTDPIATSIATAVATGATAALTDATRTLITKLANLIRERFRKKPSDQDTLEAATRNPDDRDAVGRLAALLEQRMREDPHLAQHLQALWCDIAAAGGHDHVTNTVSGQVHGSVIQVRDVYGGITINKPPPPQPPQH